ncbi:Uncharacterized protein dnm_009350 [Desulfonema magnum]|uniref:Uncharacterized protein n=1 Tax=Desulfonema magnum TaxID=45655 RepID=A0A975BGE3_9BACT|nr:Uncharacterized protein dnm_009350 [Desulfonema magnum]
MRIPKENFIKFPKFLTIFLNEVVKSVLFREREKDDDPQPLPEMISFTTPVPTSVTRSMSV